MAKKEAKAKKENNKNKKSFFKDFKAELKKVSWPTPKQLINNTVAVITIVLITSIIVFVLDLVFETANKHGVDKIKEIITSDNTTSEDETTDEITDETESNEEAADEEIVEDEEATDEETVDEESVDISEETENVESNEE
jgi:preprotein translocase subunit SecE